VPLSGVRVVDLTRILAGPFCSMLLADMGAEVIKIEPPGGGDPVRRQGVLVEGLSWYFAQFNRNKKSITLDLHAEEGKAILSRLIARADVLVENYRPGVLARMGFGEERLRELNPDLVVSGINGSGSTGPYAARPSFDFIAQAMSGFMSVNGRNGAAPMRAAMPISDLVAGLYGAFGVACALVARRGGRTRGQRVESSMMNGLISLMAYLSANYLATGQLPPRTGNEHPIAAPYGLYRAADGEVAIAPSTDDVGRRLFRALEIEPMLDRPDFSGYEQRLDHRDAVKRAGQRAHPRAHCGPLDRAPEPRGRAVWPRGGSQGGVPDPQVLAQEMLLEVEHPGHGLVRMTGFPVKLSATPCRVRLPAPELGADTEAVLRELGRGRDLAAPGAAGDLSHGRGCRHMIANAERTVLLSSLGWVDHDALWRFDVRTASVDHIPLASGARYVSLHTSASDMFAVAHHFDGARAVRYRRVLEG
jgi:crotonobetainyl-CoA:carnitine CoA-transferase CaiB-like acyl-CoA transferase